MNKKLKKIIKDHLEQGFSKEEIKNRLSQDYNVHEVDKILFYYPESELRKKYKSINILSIVLLVILVLFNIMLLIIGGSSVGIIFFALLVGFMFVRGIMEMHYGFYPVLAGFLIISAGEFIMNTDFASLISSDDFVFYAARLIVTIVLIILLLKLWFGLFPQAKEMLKKIMTK